MLIKHFQILPSEIRGKSLDELYFEQKRMFLLTASNAMDLEHFGKVDKFSRESSKIENAQTEEQWIKLDLIHPNLVEKMKERLGEQKAMIEIEKRVAIIKEQKIEELRKQIFEIEEYKQGV